MGCRRYGRRQFGPVTVAGGNVGQRAYGLVVYLVFYRPDGEGYKQHIRAESRFPTQQPARFWSLIVGRATFGPVAASFSTDLNY